MTVHIFFQSTKSPHFPLRGKVGQLSKMKREICWSTVSMVLVYGGAARRCRCLNNFPTFSCQHAPHFIFSPLLQFGEYRDFSGTGGSACKTAFALSRPVKCSDTAESCCMSCQHLCTVCTLAPPSSPSQHSQHLCTITTQHSQLSAPVYSSTPQHSQLSAPVCYNNPALSAVSTCVL